MFDSIPALLYQFLLTIGFAFIVGLEFHNYIRSNQHQFGFGSIRTFILLGLLGFVLYKLNTNGIFLLVGIIFLSAMLGIFYWRQTSHQSFSLLEIILALLVFLIGPVALSFPPWFLVLFVVLLVLLLGEKPLLHQFSENLANNEIVTLAKFLIISGVILPLLPDKQIAELLPVTYYKVWLAVIIVSGFSYLSYLAQTYVFKTRGLLLTGLLGGLYSSTAVSVVISRRAYQMKNIWAEISASLIMATAMMYLRLLVIIFLMDSSIFKQLSVFFSILIILSFVAVFCIFYFGEGDTSKKSTNISQHPLELPTAILFALMFVLFTFITQFVISHFGDQGLNYLSVAVGFTDIDPFILSLLSGKFAVPEYAIVSAIIIASGSNNLLKAIYVALLAHNRSVIAAVIWLLLLFAISLFYALTLV